MPHAAVRQRTHNPLYLSFEALRAEFVVWYSDDLNTGRFQNPVARVVAFPTELVEMGRSVKFDGQAKLSTVEVRDESRDYVLPAELVAKAPPVAKQPPGYPLRWRRLSPHLFRARDENADPRYPHAPICGLVLKILVPSEREW